MSNRIVCHAISTHLGLKSIKRRHHEYTIFVVYLTFPLSTLTEWISMLYTRSRTNKMLAIVNKEHASLKSSSGEKINGNLKLSFLPNIQGAPKKVTP